MSSSESGSSLTVTCGDGEPPAAAMAVDEDADEAPDEVATPLAAAAAAIETEFTTTLLAKPLLKEILDC